jgi:hypothetical protein
MAITFGTGLQFPTAAAAAFSALRREAFSHVAGVSSPSMMILPSTAMMFKY